MSPRAVSPSHSFLVLTRSTSTKLRAGEPSSSWPYFVDVRIRGRVMSEDERRRKQAMRCEKREQDDDGGGGRWCRTRWPTRCAGLPQTVDFGLGRAEDDCTTTIFSFFLFFSFLFFAGLPLCWLACSAHSCSYHLLHARGPFLSQSIRSLSVWPKQYSSTIGSYSTNLHQGDRIHGHTASLTASQAPKAFATSISFPRSCLDFSSGCGRRTFHGASRSCTN